MTVFKVGDEVGTISYGDGVVVGFNGSKEYPVDVKCGNEVYNFTAEGFKWSKDKYPSMWLKSTGRPPFAGEEVFEYPLYRRGVHHTYEKGLEVKFSGVNAGVVTYAPKNSSWCVGDREVGWVEHEDKTYWEPCEKPKWRPTKPTWCWVSNEGMLDLDRPYLVLYYDEETATYAVLGDTVSDYETAAPCDPEDMPDYWPKEWV